MRCSAAMLMILAAAPVWAEEKSKAPNEVLVVQNPLFGPRSKSKDARDTPSFSRRRAKPEQPRDAPKRRGSGLFGPRSKSKSENARDAPREQPPGRLKAGDIITSFGTTLSELNLVPHAQGGRGDRLERLGDGNEMEFLSDLVANLLSGNTAKLLAENEPHLLSENEVELLSGNEVELFSGNSANFMSGNKFSLTINITESGNNSGNEGSEEAVSFRKLDRDKNGRVSLQEFRGKRRGKKARRARKRFVKLDRNGNGSLSAKEMGG